MARINEPARGGESSRMLFAAGPVMARSFCGDLRYRQAAHLQGPRKHQADHGEGADQHADRYHLAFEVVHTWQRITKGPHRSKRRAPDNQRRSALFIPDQAGTSEPVSRPQDALFRGGGQLSPRLDRRSGDRAIDSQTREEMRKVRLRELTQKMRMQSGKRN
jgi:hypothetical protein